MCGIVGVVARSPVNQLLYDGMTVLQHRGQDAAGIVTAEGHSFHMHKGRGLVRDVFRTRDMRNLLGHMGIAHCRYPTAGSASSEAEAQPFYVNSPYGITLGHNGNLVNSRSCARRSTWRISATSTRTPTPRSSSTSSRTRSRTRAATAIA
jgi:amidophosphoribosyltransferase